jgi:hypothetical protein
MLTASLPLLFPRTTAALRIHRQRQAPTAKLRPIPFARHIALIVADFRTSARQRVVAEALPTVLGASDTVALRITVAHAARRGGVVVAEVRERDAAEDAGAEDVGVAAGVAPVGDGGVCWASSGAGGG